MNDLPMVAISDSGTDGIQAAQTSEVTPSLHALAWINFTMA